MHIGLTQANIALEARHAMTLTDAAGAEIGCLTGQVWLTTDGDLRDIVLTPGEVHSIERGGLTLINAIEPSLVRVRPPHARPAAWRRWLMNIWDWLVSVGEARVRARMRRGIYHLL